MRVTRLPTGEILLELDDESRIVSAKMRSGLVDLIDSICRAHGVSRSEFLRQAVIYYLRERYGINYLG